MFSYHGGVRILLLMKRTFTLFLSIFLLFVAACERDQQARQNKSEQNKANTASVCDPDDGGLSLPDGFCARIIADNLGFIRHFVVKDPTELYITQRNRRLNLGGLLAVRDSDADGYMDVFEQLSREPGMGIGILGKHLYFSSETALYRYDHTQPLLNIADSKEVIVADFPKQQRHAGKPFTFDEQGNIYINVGAPSNACQLNEGEIGGVGDEPCQQLATSAGIWQFGPEPGQSFATAKNYASGIRNAYALDWHSEIESLFIVQHGRDGLHEFWPQIYDETAGADLPAEVMLKVEQDSIHPWPYCYFDPVKMIWITAPEYGGNGEKGERCADYTKPIIGFPAHYGPNDMLFYDGEQFPDMYKHGAFVAFHGSYNRGPYEQVGYQVIFIPYTDGKLGPAWKVFADGFAGEGPVNSPEDAEYRPTGLALDREGRLYVSDSVQGRIWRIQYTK